MRVGFATIYSWRPHVEQMVYLARLVRSAGHEVRYLTCDADLPTCYTRELRPHRPRIIECNACRLASVRSYEASGVRSLGSLIQTSSDSPIASPDWGSSSASTIGRFESDEDYQNSGYAPLRDRLNRSAHVGYEATIAWIERERLDAVVAFNGRMDVTRGIFEGAKAVGVRYISMERTWFGDGLQLLPQENCLGLQSVDKLVSDWSKTPLTKEQAERAASIVAARFTRSNTREWRAYNTSAAERSWPGSGTRRVLLLPGSRNEVRGHPDRDENWTSRTEAFDALMAHSNLHPSEVVLRAHPNWSERIGLQTGVLAEEYYRNWARSRGIAFIPSADRTSTLGLIEQADAVVLVGGSAALEAGLIGKRIISLAPAAYQEAGFVDKAYEAGELATLDPLERHTADAVADWRARMTLRFCYTVARRVPQYVDYVRCIHPAQYEYIQGADPERIVSLIQTGDLAADDEQRAVDAHDEDKVLDLIKARRWADLTNPAALSRAGTVDPVKRRVIFRSIDRLRAQLPRGDY